MSQKPVIKDITTVKDAETLFKQYQAKKIPVVLDTMKEIGTLSTLNIERALAHKLLHIPINTITDYHEPYSTLRTTYDPEHVKHRYETILLPAYKTVIEMISTLAKELDMQVYLVGGIVRDLIRGAMNLDIDITLEQSGEYFAQKLSDKYDTVTIQKINPAFGTAKVVFNVENKAIAVDIATTRIETYDYPGALPSISQFNCPIEEDLHRRDFTINSLALNIHPDHFGKLTDSFSGIDDIEKGILRLNHSYSLIDDPTRIIRAVKFAVRFSYHLSPATLYLIKNCINAAIFDNFGTERLKLEIKELFNLNRFESFSYLKELELYTLINTQINKDIFSESSAKTLENSIKKHKKNIDKSKTWLIYLSIMLVSIEREEIEKVVYALNLSGKERKFIYDTTILMKKSQQECNLLKPSEIYRKFALYPPESIVGSIYFCSNPSFIDSIQDFFTTYSQIIPEISGKTLKEIGIPPGPLYSQILKDVHTKKLDGQLLNINDEINYVKETYNY